MKNRILDRFSLALYFTQNNDVKTKSRRSMTHQLFALESKQASTHSFDR